MSACSRAHAYFWDSNKADLQLLQEMGVTPDVSVREKKVSLKTVMLGVLAMVKMRRRAEGWQESKALQEVLVRQMKKQRMASQAGKVEGGKKGAVKAVR